METVSHKNLCSFVFHAKKHKHTKQKGAFSIRNIG
jgi:hypothetical protein